MVTTFISGILYTLWYSVYFPTISMCKITAFILRITARITAAVYRSKSILKGLCLSMLLLYLSVCTLYYVTQEQHVFIPSKKVAILSEYNMGDTQELFLDSTDGVKLHVWYREPNPGMPMIALFPGQSGHVARYDNLNTMRALLDKGYGFVSLSWRGYGGSTGKPAMQGLYDDARTIMEFLKSMGHEKEDLIVIGNSMGSAFAVKMATEYDIRGAVLMGTFTQGRDIGKYTFPLIPRHILREEYNFNNIDIIHNISAPLLMIHGNEDRVVHPELSKELHAAAPGSTRVVLEGVEHDIPPHFMLEEMQKVGIL